MENPHFQWENPLFLWSFSLAMLNLPEGKMAGGFADFFREVSSVISWRTEMYGYVPT